jgi:hypothetical protein
VVPAAPSSRLSCRLERCSPSIHGVPISAVLVADTVPDDWVKMAAMMQHLSEVEAWKQARKCVWYYTQGPGKDVRRRQDQGSKLFLRFFEPKRRAA